MQKRKRLIIAISLLLCAAAGWFVYIQLAQEANVGRVTRGTSVQAVPANVFVAEAFRMELKSEQGGRIAKSAIKLGQQVKAGEVLFQIDAQDLQLEIERIESEYKAAKARIELGSPLRFEIATAEENLRNSTRLFELGKLPQIELERSKRGITLLKDRMANEEITNQQTLETFEATLKFKRRAMEKMSVTVPEDGTVTEIFARTGDLVGPGTPLARVISRERLVQAQISEENFAGVQPGLSAIVQFLGYYGRRFKATVERVLPVSDEKSKRYTAFLAVDIPVEQLVPGLTGEASITIGQRENALLVERRALSGNRLYVVRNGRVQVTEVGVGFVGQNFAEVTSGVQEGDRVILDDLSSFRNGQRVRAIEVTGRN